MPQRLNLFTLGAVEHKSDLTLTEQECPMSQHMEGGNSTGQTLINREENSQDNSVIWCLLDMMPGMTDPVQVHVLAHANICHDTKSDLCFYK